MSSSDKIKDNVLCPQIISEAQSISKRNHQGIPGFEILPSGRMFATYYANDYAGEGPGNYAILAVCPPHGEWHEIQVILPPAEDLRVFDPSLWLAPDGALWWCFNLSYTTEENKIYDGRGGVFGCVCREPDCDTPVWEKPVFIGDGVMMNKPTVLADGSWAFPCAVWDAYPELMSDELKEITGANFCITSDGGKKFKFVQGPNVPERGFDEHTLIEKNNGDWWCCVRTSYGIGESFSSDGGLTWSEGSDSKLGTICSRFAMRRLKSGKLILVTHLASFRMPGEKKCSSEGRKNLTVYLSDDDGKSWYGALCIDCRENISYPDIAEGNDGFIYCIYDRERLKLGQILLSRFTESDIKAGEMLTSGAYSMKLISSFDAVRKN